MTTHEELLARHRAVMPGWMALYYEQPIALVGGEGCWVDDAEGRRYLDFFGGILTTMVGHNVPEVVDAIRDQAGRILHTSTLYLIEPQIELAERIARLSGIPDARVFFTTSGTEANEAALLMTTSKRRSNQVLALKGSYHGRSQAAMSVTGIRSWSASGYSPFAVSYVQSGYRLRSPFAQLDDDAYTAAAVADLRMVIDTTTSGDVACMIAEAIQGVGGFTIPPDGMLGAFMDVLRPLGVPFIADEVQSGWGRTGDHYWGIQAHGFTPDAMTFAKGLGNGITIAGVVATAELMEAVGANSISTFGGNPIATRAALATLDYAEAHDLQANAKVSGTRLKEGLERLAKSHEVIAEVRGKGLMIGVELVKPGTIEPDPGVATKVLEGARDAGLLIGKGGLYGNVLRIAPPLSVSEAEVDDGLGRMEEAFAGLP